MGNAYCCLGEYVKAIEYYEKDLEISTAIGDKLGRASKNMNLGNAYNHSGDDVRAIEYYEKGLEISTAIGHKSGIASSNGNLGNAYHRLGEYVKAIKYFEKGLEISTAIGDKSEIAINNGNLGNAFYSLGEFKKAIKYYEKGLEIGSAIGDKSVIAVNDENLGNAYYCLDDYVEAIKYYEKGLEISTAIGDKPRIASSNGNLGNAYRRTGQYKNALLHFERSIKLFDRIFLDGVPDQSKLFYTEEYFKFHKSSMACLLDTKDSKAALLVLDHGRAKELHFRLRKQRKDFSKSTEDYWNTVWERINAEEEDSELKEFEIILQNETCSTTVLVFAFDSEHFLNVWILNKNLIHRKLDVTLEELYLLIIECLCKFNVSVSRKSSFFKLDVPHIISENITFPPDIQNEKSSCKHARVSKIFGEDETLKVIFQLVIDPVKDLIDGNKLIIVPDGSLFFAPFSSLINDHGCYLSESYSIQITPSLQTLRATMKKSQDSNLGFALFVGNPTSDLPMAAEEVKSVANLFQATPILGYKARKQVLLEILDKASIIHIAAHGEPNSGEIMLAPNHSLGSSTSSPSTPESFLLTQDDVTNISVKARLVMLSCCHTGQGKVSSEGVIGITRAFLAAGARSVLSTLWPINDSAAKEFMEKFYEELCQETSVCEALRRTKKIFQKHEKNTTNHLRSGLHLLSMEKT